MELMLVFEIKWPGVWKNAIISVIKYGLPHIVVLLQYMQILINNIYNIGV